MLDQTNVATALREVFRVEATQSQIDFYSNGFATLDAAVESMATSAVSTQRATKFYQVYFDRLPDGPGLDFWTGIVRDDPNFADTPAGNQALADQFFTSGEFNTIYGGLTTEQAVAALYQNVLGRTPDTPGLNFWIGVVNDTTNDFNLDDLGLAFATADETNATFEPLLVSYLTTLGTGDPLPGTDIFDFATTSSGSTFNLTTGIDNLTGTADDDTFNAVFDPGGSNDTLNLGDNLNGGAGIDSLNVISGLSGTLPATTITNIENFFIRNTAPGALVVDFNSITGEQQVWADLSTGQTNFSNLATGTVIGVKGNGAVTVGDVLADYSNQADAVSIAIDGGVLQAEAAAQIDVNTSTATSATITSTGGANKVGGIGLGGSMTSVTINATTDLEIEDGNTFTQEIFGFDSAATNATLTVTGAGKVELGEIEENVDTLDASGNSGGIVAINTINAGFTGSQTINIIGSSGDDSLLADVALTTGSFDGGAGNDRLGVSSSTVLSSATEGAKFSNFEEVEVLNGVQVDMDNIAGIERVFLRDGFSSNTGFSNLTAEQALNVTALELSGTFRLDVKGAGQAGQVDTIRITVDDGDETGSEAAANTSSPRLRDVENLEIVAVDDINISSLTNTSSGGSSQLQQITTSGAGDIAISTGGETFGANTSIDGSAMTGTLTFNASGTTSASSLSITGGGGEDILRGTNISSSSGDVINGGAGADTIDGGFGNDVMTGGSGADTFIFDQGDTFSTPSETNLDRITDFEVGVDLIDLVVSISPPTITQNAIVPAPTTAAIDSEGIASFNTSDDTLGERIAAVASGLSMGSGGTPNDTFAIFEHGSNSYVFFSDSNTSVSSNDVLVELTGVTGITNSDISASGDLLLM